MVIMTPKESAKHAANYRWKYRAMTHEERFWLHVSRRRDDQCWNWKHYTRPNGYAYFGVDGVQIAAHRFSWSLVNGLIPEKMQICHKCDNKKCCNPNHLFLGTCKENIQDAVIKGLRNTPIGERQGFSFLTGEVVEKIREMAKAGGRTQKEIANRFGIKPMHAQSIISRRIWKHIP